LLLVLLIGALAAMGWSYFSARHLVTVAVNDRQTFLLTRQTTVRGALTEAGFTWNPEDVISPALDEPLPADGQITIRVAAPVTIEADGNLLHRRTQSTTVAGVLQENGIHLKPSDQVYLDGHNVSVNTKLPRYSTPAGRVAMAAPVSQPVHITVQRAVPITINDNGLVSTIYTTAPTLGAALYTSGVLVYLGDYVSPDLGSPVSAGAAVFIRRSRAASISVDGHIIKTRTRGATVADLLAQEGVQLAGKDYTDPPPTSPVLDGTGVNVTRVREVYITETQPITFQVRWLPNPNMEIDTRAVAQIGAVGAKNRLFKLVYENGKLISRGLEREWIAKPPQDHIINYGTKIVLRDLTLPDGSVVQYWRKIHVLATSYTAATSGKPSGTPEYGLTFLGLTARKGIVAVDPRLISLWSNIYVPGYGIGLAGDTGGAIKGRHIDLGYGETDFESWYRWVDVYLLTPVPPANRINYNLPDLPSDRSRQK
jgi:resuscitation-promoting factor RpfB